MAFPFAFVPGLRERLIVAIGTTSLVSAAALGCTSQRRNDPASSEAPADTETRTAAGRDAGTSSDAGPQAVAGRDGGSGTDSSSMTARAGMSGTAGRAGAGAGAQAGMSSAGKLAQAGMSGAGMAGATAQEPVMCELGGTAPMQQCFARERLEGQAQYGCAAGPPGAPREPRFTDEELETHFLPNGCLEHQLTCDGCCNPAAAPGVPQADGTCCYVFCPGSCCGRPFVVDGQPRLAELERRSDWLHTFPRANATAHDLDTRIASEWLEDARMEHASIASFARFTLDLLAFAAPPDLIALAQRAALEEIEHARLCFGLAARYGASESGPGQLAAADARVAPSLWHAAIAAFEEGCIGETMAALQARAALEHTTDREAQNVLTRIAREEASHAELAWRFITWSAKRLGHQLTEELQRRFQAHQAATTIIAEQESPKTKALLHAAGRLTPSEKSKIASTALAQVIAPCLTAIQRTTEVRL